MLTCRNCGKETNKTIAYEGQYGCPSCICVGSSSPAHLHVKAGNKFSPSMTVAEKNWITSHRGNPDGTVSWDRRK